MLKRIKHGGTRNEVNISLSIFVGIVFLILIKMQPQKVISTDGDNQPFQVITTSFATFGVMDRPDKGWLHIAPGPLSSAQKAVMQRMIPTPEIIFRDAVEEFLSRSGRSCKVAEGHLFHEPTWLFPYSCTSLSSGEHK